MSLTSNELIGTPARLAVARLGATRLGAIPRSTQVKAPGVYAWAWSDSGVKHGDPRTSVEDSWTVGRS
jgi:hypothetical protein